jgi:hypothetical protein
VIESGGERKNNDYEHVEKKEARLTYREIETKAKRKKSDR